MKVGFDVSALHGAHPAGVVRAVRCVVDALERRGRIEVVRLAPEAGRSLRAWRWRDLPRAAKNDLVGIHSFTSAFPWRGPGRRVQTVHELPWRHGVDENAGLKHRLWAALGPLFADRVLCPTEFVARDLRRRLLPGASRVRVVPWGVGPPYAEEPPPGVVDEVVLERYRLGEDPIVLCLGAVRPKKNLAAVIRGLAEVRRRNGPKIQLVVTGPDTPQLRSDLGLASRLGLGRWILTVEEVDEEHLPSLLRLASVVAVLSHSEGFGLPALEALACGTPVVVARDTAQAEVAGVCGIEVEPDDPASVADGLERAVREREELRYRLPERARELSWDACAERIEAVWEELV
ncbi:MAG: glycosyltransferase family 1 protein [Planctomycetota bacterium]|nr:glycosyltransferase family 1 protein [Planctomycetota bacterium]